MNSPIRPCRDCDSGFELSRRQFFRTTAAAALAAGGVPLVGTRRQLGDGAPEARLGRGPALLAKIAGRLARLRTGEEGIQPVRVEGDRFGRAFTFPRGRLGRACEGRGRAVVSVPGRGRGHRLPGDRDEECRAQRDPGPTEHRPRLRTDHDAGNFLGVEGRFQPGT